MSAAPALGPSFAAFAAGYDFALDDYQVEACAHIEAGSGVLVAAPTGAGKTVAGEFAVFLALQRGRKCFYTTPIKALSNQKYHDPVSYTHLDVYKRQRLDYHGPSRGVATRPLVDPERIVVRDGYAYLDAWSHERGAWRSFRLDRIVAVTPTDRPVSDLSLIHI